MKKEKKFKTRHLLMFIGSFVLLFILFTMFFTKYYIDYLWFSEVNYLSVYLKKITARIDLFIPVFLVVFIGSLFYFRFLFNELKKSNAKTNLRRLNLACSLIFSFIISFTISNNLWYKFLEFKNSVNFSILDPIFNNDISFYIFKLPFYKELLSSGFTIIISLLVITIIVSIFKVSGKILNITLYEIFPKENESQFFKSMWDNFKLPLSILSMIFFFLLGINNYFKIYSALYASGGGVYGASYVDIKFIIPLCIALAIACVICGLFSLYFGYKEKFKPIIFAIVMVFIVTTSLNILGIVPQNLIVSDNQYKKEKTYIKNNIEATNKAYGLDKINVAYIDIKDENREKVFINNEKTLNNLTVNDQNQTLAMFNVLQSYKKYYEFNDIDVDRYKINGENTQVYISARELNSTLLDLKSKTWVNLYTKYTHGYGNVLSSVNQVNEINQSLLLQKNIPINQISNTLKVDEPRIYYGELTNHYIITNTKNEEIDYPIGKANKIYKYEGMGGISLKGINKIAFAISNLSSQILVSKDITNNSKILIRRNVTERAKKIAPFLEYDSDPYLVLVDGKYYYIIDAFTTSSNYPYSKPVIFKKNQINYIRNSVKVVVDAFNGETSFYLIDKEDKLALVYKNIYKDLFKDIDDMDVKLREHLRYSKDLLKLQSEIYTKYHTKDAKVFYDNKDNWQIPIDAMPKYQISKFEKNKKEEFCLNMPFMVKGEDNVVVSILSANCDTLNYGQLNLYKFTSDKKIYSNSYVANLIDSDKNVKEAITLLEDMGHEVIKGEMSFALIGNNIIHAMPIYSRENNNNNKAKKIDSNEVSKKEYNKYLPRLKKVVLVYDGEVVIANTYDKAISKLSKIKIDMHIKSNERNYNLSKDELLIKANELFIEIKKAQKENNFSAYSVYMDEIKLIINELKNKK